MISETNIFSYRPYWAKRLLPSPVLPMSRDEMEQLGWDSCDIILVTGDAYVDHPSFGMAVIGRLLEAQGFRVGIISQPDWTSAEDFKQLGRPNLFFGVTAGNMDSMVNRYTSDRRIRSDDAYTPDGKGGKRPDRSVIVYSQRCREAYKNVPLIIGGIEASLRRMAHYDYWSDKIRRSVLIDAKADMLLYGNAERAIVKVAHHIASGKAVNEIRDIRGAAFILKQSPSDWVELDSTELDEPKGQSAHPNPYQFENKCNNNDVAQSKREVPVVIHNIREVQANLRNKIVVRLPSYEKVKEDPVLYAHASRVFHLETNPGNARPLIQAYGNREIWINPPPVPLSSKELDRVFELPYTRQPHSSYGSDKIPAYDMIRFSINIMRGCFGGCTFCSITEHEGRIIQNRSEDSIIREVEAIRDTTPGFTGTISDLGGPTANMWNLHCKDEKIESACRRLSCVYPDICKHMHTDQKPLIELYRRARSVKGIKRVLIASGLRYDLAVRTPKYVKELVTHHVGGYLKIAPEHTEDAPLSYMMKPGIGTYDQFKQMFEKFSKEAGKEQYLIPYFISSHPGSSDKDVLNLALWLKSNNFRLDQVQNFLPSPMAIATAMYHSGKNPLKRIHRKGGDVFTAKGGRQRRIHKAFLRYHDPSNWPILREALKAMGRADLIGNGKKHLVPAWQPRNSTPEKNSRRVTKKQRQSSRRFRK
ncbi:MAG: YgiQ family radical SAM protein [gamma proteobacterium symbiont of Bathyaustriella thionipta]|nr:YgiQ family radical SAM protein [gamma proteobacterium symbiont of Bathyaustriella thionipta]MCU7951144.1 YgiQ family radical SAM protein [gamma proteobacterium symbiont of Bathyaustriella thionipta]MCU7954418.1 YgiQ family radical SAM protein [gamma proteobacterium symbiont of Bathyaustriella thionipta]MCU7957657.1 YgiQ family radical SAM protein [gamma proteobacterium symbiont of Bathyaustriella thionipta]MCU7966671.1 YgiQ family radical SAM protein [gamma proteobacterium symbiont of Bathy